MEFTLTKEQKALRKEMVCFAQETLADESLLERDHKHQFSKALWQKCGEMKLQGMHVAEDLGGRGLNAQETALALEGLGFGCEDGGLMMALSAHLLACVTPIRNFGSDALKQRYLPALSDGSLIAVNGMTEPESGSDAFNMQTTAVKDGDGYRLNGVKTLTTNGPVADVAVVYAMTEPEKGAMGGVSAFVVPTDAEGFSASPRFEKMGLRTVAMGELKMEDVFVSADQMIGEEGAGMAIFNDSMDWERVCLVAGHVGRMEKLLQQCIAFARTRKSGGEPIGKKQAVSHKIADMKIRLEAARLLTRRGAWELDQERSASMDASITKLFVSEALVDTALDAVRVFGGHGYLAENDVERALRDSIGGTLYSGTSDIQRNIIAGWLGL